MELVKETSRDFCIKIVASDEKLLPRKLTEGSLGYDVFCPEKYILRPFEPVTIPLNFVVEFMRGVGGFLMGRSSLGQRGVVVLGGVIDSDYRGELMGLLVNVNAGHNIELNEGDRIMQLVPINSANTIVELVKNLTPTERMEGRFGSTGK